MRSLVDDLAASFMDAGAYFSRPYGSWAPPVYNHDAAARDALRKVKAIFDPVGVLNPGKLCFGAPKAPPVIAGNERPQVAALRDVHGEAASHEREEA
jgi:FAD linked oxidases, C-terminal domain